MDVMGLFEITSSQRIYWIYLASSLILSFLFLGSFKVLSLKYIFNKSSALDLKLFIFNRVFKSLFIAPFEAGLVLSFSTFLYTLTPQFNLELSHNLLLFAFSLLAFVVDDFFRFIQHYMMHKVSFLWELHKVHHSAHILNPLSLYRIHSFEVVIALFRRVAATGLSVILFLSLTGQSPSAYEILGVHAFSFIFNLIGGNLRHSHIALSFGFLEHLFISPAQHQIHHSKAQEDYDKNFGVALAIWDKAFRTWKPYQKRKILFGLNYSQRNHQLNLGSSLIDPVIKSILTIKRKTKMKKISILIAAFILSSCGGSGDNNNKISSPDSFSEPKNFSTQKYAEGLVIDLYQKELSNMQKKLSETMTQTNSCENFKSEELKSLWKDSMLSYQRIMPLQHIGVLGGHDGIGFTYQKIYSGVFSYSKCGVQDFIAQNSPTEKKVGLDVLEFLIYQGVEKNHCLKHPTKEATVQSWLDSDPSKKLCKSINLIAEKTKAYVDKALEEVASASQSKDGLRGIFKRDPLQDIYDSLTSFVDQDLKDEKLGTPIGVNHKTCFKNVSCPSHIEHQDSKLYFEALMENYKSIAYIFSLNEDPLAAANPNGLYLYLKINGHVNLAEKIFKSIQNGYKNLLTYKGQDFPKLLSDINNAAAQERCLKTTTQSVQEPVCSLYAYAKDLSDLIKKDLKVALSLSNVQQVQGDSD